MFLLRFLSLLLLLLLFSFSFSFLSADHELVHGRSQEQIPEWQQKADYATSLCITQMFAGLEGEAVKPILEIINHMPLH